IPTRRSSDLWPVATVNTCGVNGRGLVACFVQKRVCRFKILTKHRRSDNRASKVVGVIKHVTMRATVVAIFNRARVYSVKAFVSHIAAKYGGAAGAKAAYACVTVNDYVLNRVSHAGHLSVKLTCTYSSSAVY